MTRGRYGVTTDLVLSVPEVLEDASKSTLLHALLLTGESGDLSRRPADEDLGLIAKSRGGEVLRDHGRVDVSSLTCEARSRQLGSLIVSSVTGDAPFQFASALSRV